MHEIPKTDCWSLGILAITLILSSRSILRFDDHAMLDENDHFNPSVTDTVFHLLDSSKPWFRDWMDMVGNGMGYAPAIVEQALKLVIFCKSLIAVTDGETVAYDMVFRGSALHKNIIDCYSRTGNTIYEDYRRNTSHPFEMAIITVRSVCLRECPRIWSVIIKCLKWHTSVRCSFKEALVELGWKVPRVIDPDMPPLPIPERMTEVTGK